MNNKEIVIRLLIAVIIGGLIGYEREYKKRPAGFRTHVLVCVGAAIISMIQISIGQSTIDLVTSNVALKEVFKIDYGRLGAQVITGVGFLGAGTIIHQKGSVKGLTTAATIWTVACVGLAIGLGYYFLSISSAILIFMILIIFKKLEGRLIYKKTNMKLIIEYNNGLDHSGEIQNYFEKHSIDIVDIYVIVEDNKNKKCKVEYSINVPNALSSSSLVKDFALFKEVNSYKFTKKIKVDNPFNNLDIK